MTVKWQGPAMIEVLQGRIMRAVIRGAEGILETANRKIMDPPKTGKIYKRRGISHQASAPGQSPATDTGHLIQSGTTSYDVAELSATVNWSAVYAAAQEFGSENMEARPFARPAVAERAEAIQQDVAASIREGLALFGKTP